MTNSAYKGRNISRENPTSGLHRGAASRSGANVHKAAAAQHAGGAVSADLGRRASAGKKTSGALSKSDAKRKNNTAVAADVKQAAKVKNKRSVTKLITIMSEQKYSFPVAAVFVACLFTTLVLTIVTASVRINDVSVDISSLKSQISTSEKTAEQLRMQLETRDDLRTVENLAKSEYGMVEADQVERYYLITENSDRIEMIEEVKQERTSMLKRIPEFFGAAVERIRKTFGW